MGSCTWSHVSTTPGARLPVNALSVLPLLRTMRQKFHHHPPITPSSFWSTRAGWQGGHHPLKHTLRYPTVHNSLIHTNSTSKLLSICEGQSSGAKWQNTPEERPDQAGSRPCQQHQSAALVHGLRPRRRSPPDRASPGPPSARSD